MTIFSDGMLLGQDSALAIAYVSSSTGTASSVDLVINKPVGVQSGDFMIAFIWGTGFSSVTSTGWVQVFISTGADADLAVFTKKATGSEPSSYTLSSTENNRIGIIAAYRGGVGAVNVQAASTNESSSSISTATSITPTLPGILLTTLAIRDATRTITVPPPGMTLRAQSSIAFIQATVYELAPSPAGATGSKTLTWSGAGITAGWSVQIY